MLRVLVVDDEEMVRSMLANLLAREGFSVVTACSAAGGIDMLNQEPIDVVVTDLRMESPVAGFDVVRAANERVPRPAIIVLTAYPVPASDWRAAGADELIVKGANTLGLPKRLQALLTQRAA